jgi:restriction endonuclease S subunit
VTRWREVTLGEVADVSTGQSAPQDVKHFGGSNRFVRVKHLDLGSHSVVGYDSITDEAVADLNLRLFPKGTIVFPKSGASIRLEKRALLPFDAYLVSHLAAVQPSPDLVDPLFLFYALRRHRFAAGKSDGYPTLKISEVRTTRVSMPPMSDQQAIAGVLRTIEQAREATEAVLVAAREVKRSLVRHLYSYGSRLQTGTGALTSPGPYGEVREDWRVARLGDVVRAGGGLLQTGPFGSLLHASEYVPDGVPFVMPKDLTADGSISTNSVARLSSAAAKRLHRYRARPGDVLVGRRGEIGRRGIVPAEGDGWVCGTGCLLVRCGENLDPTFLCQLLELPAARAWLRDHAVGATMANLSTTILASLPVVVPPIAEQRWIASSLAAADRKVAVEQEVRTALAALLESVADALLTGRSSIESVKAAE